MDRPAKRGPRPPARWLSSLAVLCPLVLALCCLGLAGCSEDAHADGQATDPVVSEGAETQGRAAGPALDDRELNELRESGVIDEHGNPTVRALLSSEDATLVELLDQLGFAFDAERGGWLRPGPADPCFVGALDAGGAMDEGDLIGATTGAEAPARYYLLQPGSYDSVEDALVGAAGCPLVDHELVDDGTGVAVLAGADGAGLALVLASALDRGAISLAVFDEGAIAAGLLDEAADADLGRTLDEAWPSLAGRALTPSQAAS